MKLEKKRYDEIVILKFTGELEAFNLPGFTERMERWIQSGDVRFVFDVRLLTFLNSSAFGYILRLRKVLAEKGGGLVLARPSKFVRKTIKTYGVEGILPLAETVEDAILHFKKGADVAQLALEGTESDEALQGEVPVIFRLRAEEGADEAPNQVGRIVSLYEDGILFHYEAASNLDPVELNVGVGTLLKLKFRQPFVVKDRYFEMDARVREVGVFEDAGNENRVLAVRVDWEEISDQDRQDLERFIRDQAEWRREVQGA